MFVILIILNVLLHLISILTLDNSVKMLLKLQL